MEFAVLREEFRARFPEAGEPFVCRAPGRINLLGEHLDYNGLPVLPMAIDREVILAFTGSPEPRVRLRNTDPRFPDADFDVVPDLRPSPPGSWDNYAKAAIAGLNAHFGITEPPGLDVLVAGNLPSAAGLSSSSALVVASALAYLAAAGYTLERDISRRDLARILANAEHFVGTAGGGMDQAILLNAEAGHATKINFIPFQFESLPIPDEAVFLVCDSMVRAEKSGDALLRYNAGPAVCSLITNMINVHLAREFGPEFAIDCLGDLWFGPLCYTRKEVYQLLGEVIRAPRLDGPSIIRFLGMPADLVREYWLDSIPAEPEGIPLQARARHVVTEYYRVEEARDALLAGDLKLFGRLMDGSHQSCRDDYGISTPELDALADALREAGCLGARLTGAGFGGAVIGLAPAKRAEAILEAVRERYYAPRLKRGEAAPAFVARASGAAGYWKGEG